MASAEIITIGTELLLGEIQDTNTRYLARFLRDLGVDIYRTTTVGDNEERIAQVIRESMQRCNIIITTGGLGPTVDDPTRAAVALALGVQTEFRPELWEQIQTRFSRYGRQPSENNRRQAWIPVGSIPVENPVGTAPCFIAEVGECSIISLPGVPREMEYLMQNTILPYLREHFALRGTIKARVLHVAGVGESTVDEWIGDLEALPNPSVGLLAHPGQVDIRITAKAESIESADLMIAEMEARVRERVKEGLYGADQDTLEEVVMQELQNRGWSLAVLECGLKGNLYNRLKRLNIQQEAFENHQDPCELPHLLQNLQRFREQRQAQAALGISLQPAQDKQILYIVVITPENTAQFTRSFGGERALSNPWSINSGLEMLRRATLL
jgi:nicotinamide-nucleotide amidase